MSSLVLAVYVRDAPGDIERLLGLLRRRRLRIDALVVNRVATEGASEVVIRFSQLDVAPQRVADEIVALADVVSLRRLADDTQFPKPTVKPVEGVSGGYQRS